MKPHLLIPALVTILSFAAPLAAQAKDKHDDHDRKHKDVPKSKHHSDSRNYGSHDYGSHDYGSHDYGSRYGHGSHYYGSGYGYDRGYRSSYYSRPSLGITIYSHSSNGYRGGSSYRDNVAVDVQRELRQRGYYRGSIDGSIGAGSREAIRAFQYDRGLAATGRIDSSLLRALGIG